MKKYKVAVIGCGRIVGHHLNSLKKIPEFQILALCDLDISKAEVYAKECNAKPFSNYRLMLKEIPEIDIVVIATPSGMHYEHTIEIIENYKKHVIIEKPTFLKIDHIKNAYSAAKQNNLFIFPVFQNRYNKAVQRVKNAIDNGELGEIRITNVRLRWCRPQRYYDLSDWRGTYSHDGGALTNQGIHHLDLLRYLGGEINSVNATMSTLGAKIEVEDSVVGLLKYNSGSIGSLEVTTAARPDDFEASISIVGSKGLAQLGGIAVNKLEVFTPDPNSCVVYSDDFSDLPDRGRVYGRGHLSMYRDILNKFTNGVDYPISMNDCLSTIVLLNSIYSSSEQSKWINTKDFIQSINLGKPNDAISNLYRT